MRLLTAIALCLALALFAACGDDDDSGNGAPSGDATEAPPGPHVRGEITTLGPYVPDENDGAIRVDGEQQDDTIYSRAVATFNDDTEVFRREGDNDVEASIDDLEVGQTVEVTFTGPVAESDPVIGTASEIVILED